LDTLFRVGEMSVIRQALTLINKEKSQALGKVLAF
jgi:hypothetical protein